MAHQVCLALHHPVSVPQVSLADHQACLCPQECLDSLARLHLGSNLLANESRALSERIFVEIKSLFTVGSLTLQISDCPKVKSCRKPPTLYCCTQVKVSSKTSALYYTLVFLNLSRISLLSFESSFSNNFNSPSSHLSTAPVVPAGSVFIKA